MKCTKEALEALIRDRYGSIPRLAKAIGLSEQTIYTCIKGKLVCSYMATAMPIIAALDLDPFELMEGRIKLLSDSEEGFINVPLFDSLREGSRDELEEANDFAAIPAAKHRQFPRAFLLKMPDNAMNRAFPAGSFVLIDPEREIEHPGQPYAICLNGNPAIVRRAYPLGNGVELLPHSTDITLRPIIYDYSSQEVQSIHIVGRVVWCTLPLDWNFEAVS